MDARKVNTFMKLAGQRTTDSFRQGDEKERVLGAQLLLSEVLEYVIKGLGVTPVVKGTPIEDPNGLEYEIKTPEVDQVQMIDGLADVAYTMYWNSEAFGVPLETAYSLVCDNNLEKFVSLTSDWVVPNGDLSEDQWHCNQDVQWPAEVVAVEVLEVNSKKYAAGKDKNGKVRKPSHFKSVDLAELMV